MSYPQRHVHLDFHTSPFIPGVAADFDAETFADTLVEARVQNINIFAKCHHGMSYYPTKIGKMHPALGGRDLLGEMIEALHRRGITCPVYTTVVWEEHVADTHPEWRQMFADGRFAQIKNSADGHTVQPGGWRFNSFAHPDYQDYFEAHLSELIDNYDLDGLWIDILFHEQGADFNPAVRPLRAKWGVEADTPRDNMIFESLAQEAFAERFTRFIRGRLPNCTLFYNSTNRAYADNRYGWVGRARHLDHFEIESLPSGFWGYYHYPRLARQAMTWNIPFLGMTGRFQKMWGDFGGLKPRAALEFECFRTQADGGACCVGDQMHPRGVLDAGAYRLIGEVYRQVEAAEPFYAETRPVFHGGVFLAAVPGMNETLAGQSEEGAVLMCDELKHYVCVLDDSSRLDGLPFVVLPDSTPVSPALREKLRAYHAAGGKLILSHRAGFGEDGRWALDFLPITVKGLEPLFPSYWSVGGDNRVVYQQGSIAEPGPGARTLIERVPSYFNRSDLTFCSHFQTPPNPQAPRGAAVIVGPGFAYFADPVFREYRQAGNVFLREGFEAALRELGVQPFLGAGLDPHILAVPRQAKDGLRVTLLNYIPSRKSLAIDVIERGLSFAGQVLRPGPDVRRVEVWPTGEALPAVEGGGFALPAQATGRLLLRLLT